MKAIILAAGVGKRLGPSGGDGPKCLIPIGGTSLLLRTLRSLNRLGIGQRVIVVGHRREKIEQVLAGHRGEAGPVRLRINPDFMKGSIVSLWSVRDEFDDDLLIMDADVLYPDALLSKLVHSNHPNALLLDPRSESTGEEMMLMVRGDRVVHMGRKAQGRYDRMGEGVGFLKLSRGDAPVLGEVLEELIRAGRDDSDYEEAIDLFLQRAEVGYELVDALPWTEIDFPEDIERAEKEVLPRMREEE